MDESTISPRDLSRSPRVLVVDQAPERRRRLAATVRRLGCRAIEATTPLEAIAVLQQRDSQVTAAAVAEDLTQTAGRELVRFLSEAYADMRLALVTHSDVTDESDDDASVLRFSDTADFDDSLRRLVE